MTIEVTELLLIGWTDFDELLCVSLSWSLDGLDSQVELVGCAAIGFMGFLYVTLYSIVFLYGISYVFVSGRFFEEKNRKMGVEN